MVADAASIVYGVLLFVAPLIGVPVLTWWFGAYALVFGIALLVLAVHMRAWLPTILRNEFYAEYRKRRRYVQDADESYMNTMVTQPAQIAHAQHDELLGAPKQIDDTPVLRRHDRAK